jgi:hypothetical protein
LVVSGGEVAKLGKIDGVNQWPSLMENNNAIIRSGMLLNIGDLDDMEAIIDGKYKLIKSTTQHGVYDGFYGEDGRGLTDPPYDDAGVITSPVSKAINSFHGKTSTNEHRLKERIKEIRMKATVNCGVNRRHYIGGPYCRYYCLFDLEEDPCETNNLVSKHPNITESLRKKLEQLKSEMVPELTRPVDRDSNPSFFNNTWVCWLDDENVKKVPKTDATRITNCTVSGSFAKKLSPVYILTLYIVFIWLFERFLIGGSGI